ncbi:MAG TPA: GntR family transcriptional regulator [Aggregatilineales bacterium]|nr:GntR family transcriptional regulator [Aggregatilineales bacterium]
MQLPTLTITDHKQLHNVVLDRLRDKIMRGELHAGEWLRQERLARELGVSHTPIREALKQLEVEGLVEHVPYRGVRVVEFSMDAVAEIYDMRTVLEGLAARAAAERLTFEELCELKRLHEAMMAIGTVTTPEKVEAIRQLNRAFHLQIIHASHRAYLIRTLEQMWSWFPTMLWSQYALEADAATPKRAGADNRDHGEIVAALEARNPAKAEAAMRYHIEQTRQALMYHFSTMPEANP